MSNSRTAYFLPSGSRWQEMKPTFPEASEAMLSRPSDHRAKKSSGQTRSNHLESLALFPGIILLFSVVTAIFFWQWIPHLNSALIGPPEDNQEDFWNTWYAAVARYLDHPFF